MSEPKQKCVQCGDEVPAGLILSHCPECDTTLPPPRPAAPAPTPQVGSVKCEVAAPTEPVTPTEDEPTRQERAKAWDVWEAWHAGGSLTDLIARALARTRAEAMEEAAQVLEKYAELNATAASVVKKDREKLEIQAAVLREAAAAIRAKGGR